MSLVAMTLQANAAILLADAATSIRLCTSTVVNGVKINVQVNVPIAYSLARTAIGVERRFEHAPLSSPTGSFPVSLHHGGDAIDASGQARLAFETAASPAEEQRYRRQGRVGELDVATVRQPAM